MKRPHPIPAAAPLLLAMLLATGCARDAAPPAAPASAPAAQPAAVPATVGAPVASATPSTATAAPGTSPAARSKPDHPTLAVKTFAGETWTLAAHRGHWVVVNFWATWCNPCLKEIPDLAAFDARRKDVDVIGLAYEEIERADMAAFLKDHPIPYPIAVLDVYAPPADFDTPRGLPMTYVIAPDGKVARTFLGPVEIGALEQVVGNGARAVPAAHAGS